MAYRNFRDSSGVEWEAWEVMPSLVERRLEQRRRASRPIGFDDRRLAVERRMRDGRRAALSGLEKGWLCFEAVVEKRRLTPIPADWPGCDDACLEAYLRSAQPVRRTSGTLPPALARALGTRDGSAGQPGKVTGD